MKFRVTEAPASAAVTIGQVLTLEETAQPLELDAASLRADFEAEFHPSAVSVDECGIWLTLIEEP